MSAISEPRESNEAGQREPLDYGLLYIRSLYYEERDATSAERTINFVLIQYSDYYSSRSWRR